MTDDNDHSRNTGRQVAADSAGELRKLVDYGKLTFSSKMNEALTL